MINKETLASIEEKTIVFYSDELTAVKLETGEIYVPVARLCDNLGLSWPGQFERIQRDEVLSEEIESIRITRMQSSKTRARPEQDMVCLPLDLIPGWLFGIQTGRVKENIRPKLIRYRRECFRVLWDAFKSDILPGLDPALVPSTADLTPAERALALAEAVATMARQQVTMERWLAHHDDRLDMVEDVAQAAHERLDNAAQVVGDHGQRLQRLELTIAGGATVTDAQAAAISEAVKTLAFQLGKAEKDKDHGPHDPRGANPYQRVYSELYRKFRVPSYRALPLESFPAVMRWLIDWWQAIADEPPPFGAHDVGRQLGS